MRVEERIAIRAKAANLRIWLKEKGIEALESKVIGRCGMLTIAEPLPEELADMVTLVHENVGGLTRRTWAARLGGCYVNWREC